MALGRSYLKVGTRKRRRAYLGVCSWVSMTMLHSCTCEGVLCVGVMGWPLLLVYHDDVIPALINPFFFF